MHKRNPPIGISAAWMLNENYEKLVAEQNLVRSINWVILMIEMSEKDRNIADSNYQFPDFEDGGNRDNS